MKKEDLIAKARERGIELTEEQAEKYINLSEEELENIAGGEASICSDYHHRLKTGINNGVDEANYCYFYDGTRPKGDRYPRSCFECSHCYCTAADDSIYCTKREAWEAP